MPCTTRTEAPAIGGSGVAAPRKRTVKVFSSSLMLSIRSARRLLPSSATTHWPPASLPGLPSKVYSPAVVATVRPTAWASSGTR